MEFSKQATIPTKDWDSARVDVPPLVPDLDQAKPLDPKKVE